MVASFGLILSQSCKKEKDTPAEYIATNESFAGFHSWQLAATKLGPDPSLGGMAHGGNDSTVTRKIYFKNGQNPVNGKYPVGTIVVKHSTNTAGTLNEITGMVKRGNNFDPSKNDWEYFMLNADGTIASDATGMVMRGAALMNGMCVGCHGGASGKDYIFSK